MKHTHTLLFLFSIQIILAQEPDRLPFPWCNDTTLLLIDERGNQYPATEKALPYPTIEQQESVLTSFRKNGKYGFKNRQGEVVIAAGYEQAGRFKEGFTWVKLDHKRYYYLDKNADPLVYYTFDRCFDFQDGLGRVFDINTNKGYNGYGFINKKGAVVIPLIYEKAFDFIGGYALVKDGQGWWLIDKTGAKLHGPNANMVYQNDRFACKQ